MSADAKAGMIKVPGPRLRRFVPLRFVRARGHGRKSVYAELNLTAMVDMLTILVVFLLQMFSASGELSVQRNLVLPDARNFAELQSAEVIAINNQAVTFHDTVVDLADLAKDDNSDWKIVPVHDLLIQIKNNWALLHPGEAFNEMLIVQADKGVDFKVLKKLLYTCGLAGWSNVNFAVRQGGRT